VIPTSLNWTIERSFRGCAAFPAGTADFGHRHRSPVEFVQVAGPAQQAIRRCSTKSSLTSAAATTDLSCKQIAVWVVTTALSPSVPGVEDGPRARNACEQDQKTACSGSMSTTISIAVIAAALTSPAPSTLSGVIRFDDGLFPA
jgi:hypothetical protein